MNKVLLVLGVLLTFGMSNNAQINLLPLGLGDKSGAGQIVLAGGVQEKERKIERLKEKSEALKKSQAAFEQQAQGDITAVKAAIADIKEELKIAGADSDFLNKQLALYNEMLQALIDTQVLYPKLYSIVNQNTGLIQEFLKEKTARAPAKTSYSFDELQEVHKKIAGQEEELARLHEEIVVIENELDNRKREEVGFIKKLAEKEKDAKELQKEFQEATGSLEIDVRHKSTLLDLDKQLLGYQKALAALKVEETTYNIDLLKTRILITESKINQFKRDLDTIERALWVHESDVEKAAEELDKKRRGVAELQTQYSQKIKELSSDYEKGKRQLVRWAKEYALAESELGFLDDWSINPASASSEYGAYRLGALNTRLQLLERSIALETAQKELENERLVILSTEEKILNTWYKITQRKLKTEEAIKTEIGGYEALRAETKRKVAAYKEKITTANNLMNIQTRALTNVKEKHTQLLEHQEAFAQKFGRLTLREAIQLLEASEKSINEQIALNGNIIKTYWSLTALASDSVKQLNAVIAKLGTIGSVLQRSELAISWASFKNIVPDLRLFLLDMHNVFYSYFAELQSTQITQNIHSFFSAPIKLVYSILVAIGLLLLFFLLQRYVPLIGNKLATVGISNRRWLFLVRFCALIFGFIGEHVASLFIWALVFLLLATDTVVSIGVVLLFYLFSIVYLCSLFRAFAHYFIRFNETHDHIIISAAFQQRFVRVLLFFSCASSAILCFREAFLTVTYGKSELPIILNAFFWIVVQISLVLLIGKEEILSIVPTRNRLWQWVGEVIDIYYYLLLFVIIALMVMSDPHIGGFGKLVTYMLWSSVWTIVLVTVLWWIQSLLKHSSYLIFFSPDESGGLKERFSQAKTWYGLFVVVAFIGLIVAGVFLGARIWGYPITFSYFDFLGLELFSTLTRDGKEISFKIIDLLKVAASVLLGIVGAWFFSRFVLERIFTLLFVDPGVQNTVTRISNYLFVIVALFIGLAHVGLGASLQYYIIALLLAIAWAVKQPVNDIIAYFILLVERSIKIGDFIEVDERITGVVRKISIRSVVLRRKNSVSIIVPNSHLTKVPFYNWNYTRGFFAFDDVTLTVSYDVNPHDVRAILLKVLDENPQVLKSPAPIVRLHNFGDNGYVFMVRGFLSTVNVINQWDIMSTIRLEIVRVLRQEGIRIMPQHILKLSYDQVDSVPKAEEELQS